MLGYIIMYIYPQVKQKNMICICEKKEKEKKKLIGEALESLSLLFL